MRLRITRNPIRRGTGESTLDDMEDIDIRSKRFVTADMFESGDNIVIRRDDGQCLSITPKDDGFEVKHFADNDEEEIYFSHKFMVHSGFPPAPEVTE